MDSGIASDHPIPEFAIYTFSIDEDQETARHWRRHDSTPDMDHALAQAQALYNTGRYERIEVRRRAFDMRVNRMTDSILRRYEDEKFLNFSMMVVLLFAAICGATAFAMIGWLV